VGIFELLFGELQEKGRLPYFSVANDDVLERQKHGCSKSTDTAFLTTDTSLLQELINGC
jgi:hypothetical protein